MKIYLTGTGTSQGVPVIGCRCAVCTSSDSRDNRLRAAALLTSETTHVAIDAGPDFRQQMLRTGIDHLEALVLTHEHNDHVAGLDDIRPFNFIQKAALRVYAQARVVREVRTRFAYIFQEQTYPGAPTIDFFEVEPYQDYQIGDLVITPFLVYHGQLPILGVKAGPFAYITDANTLPTKSLALISKCQVVVLNALHHRRHHSHFNLEQALGVAEQLEAREIWLTHISHSMGSYEEVNPTLPGPVQLAYDGLVVKV